MRILANKKSRNYVNFLHVKSWIPRYDSEITHI